MKIRKYLVIFIILCIGFFSCKNSNDLNFIKGPLLISNADSPALLTCYVNFELKDNYEKMAFTILHPEDEIKIKYDASEKGEEGYFLFLFWPATEHRISLESTGNDGITRTTGIFLL